MTTAADRLPDSIAAALRDLKARLQAHYAGRLAEARLYGSNARGEAGPESDVAVLVVVDAVRQVSDRTAALELGFDVALETGCRSRSRCSASTSCRSCAARRPCWRGTSTATASSCEGSWRP